LLTICVSFSIFWNWSEIVNNTIFIY